MNWKAQTKRGTRRVLWVLNQLFWQQFVPIASGRITVVSVNKIMKSLPRTASPFLSEHALRTQAVDGAIMAELLAGRAWAKYALPKGLPAENKRVLAIENDPHELSDFSGTIESGYGKGTKTLLITDNVIIKVGGKTSVQRINYHYHVADVAGPHFDVVVTGIEPGTKQWELNVPRGEFKGRYAFVTTLNGMLITRMVDNGVLLPKPNYTLRKEDILSKIDPSKVIVERKIDGSLGNATIKDQRVMFRSHREGGETYYDKLPAIEWIGNKSPFVLSRLLYSGPALTGTIFQGELSHGDGSARVSGILNSLAPNARAMQMQRGPVRYYVWDISRYRGRDVSHLPYSERRALYERLVAEVRQTNKFWDVAEKMDRRHDLTIEEFYDRVISSPLPWGEGIVIKPADNSIQNWDKIKMTGFGYFELVNVLPGNGKYAHTAGNLVVRNRQNGAIGEVGSFSVPDDFRDWVWEHRSDLVGEDVKVRSQEITARGVPRAGVFYGFHNGEVDLLMSAEANAAGTNRTPKEVMYAMKSAAGWRKNA